MDYPNEHEYIEEQRNRIEWALRDYFLGDTDIVWFKCNAYENVIEKIDAQVLIFTDLIEEYNFQIKSSGHINNFTVGQNTLNSYLNNDYNLHFLMVVFFKNDHLYLFNWSEFIDLASEFNSYWRLNQNPKTGKWYYIIPTEDLLDNLDFERLRV